MEKSGVEQDAEEETMKHLNAERHGEIRFSSPEGEKIYKVFAAFRTKIYMNRDDVFQYYESVGALTEEEYQQTVDSVRALSIPRLPDAPTYSNPT